MNLVDDSEAEAQTVGAASTAAPHKRHHRVRTVILVVGAVLVALVAVAVIAYLLRAKPGAVSIKSAGKAYSATTTTIPTPKAFALPPAGVYRASGSGYEQVAVPRTRSTTARSCR